MSARMAVSFSAVSSFGSSDLCHKTFYGRNLQITVFVLNKFLFSIFIVTLSVVMVNVIILSGMAPL